MNFSGFIQNIFDTKFYSQSYPQFHVIQKGFSLLNKMIRGGSHITITSNQRVIA